MPTQLSKLDAAIKTVADKIRRCRDKSIGEENTKATLIEPLLGALGWNIGDVDEVHREFRPTTNDSPVDYALMISRRARILVEAKGLGERLSERKLIAQVLRYATVAGVEWCVLTDGNEYCIYNATAAVRADEKLFQRVRISENKDGSVPGVLELISRINTEENLLDRLWDAYFVDRRVKDAIRAVFGSPDKGLVRLLRKRHPNLAAKEITNSLRRLDIQIESLDAMVPPPRTRTSRSGRKGRSKKTPRSRRTYNVSLTDIIEAGLLKPPVELFKKYKQKLLKATILKNGDVSFEGKRYKSCSTAAECARGTVTGRRMNTNGWIFWCYNDADEKKHELDDARKRLLAQRA